MSVVYHVAVICFAVPFLSDYVSFAVVTTIHGLFTSTYISTQVLSALDIFGIENVNAVTGVLHFLTGIGAFATPPVISHLFEDTHPLYLPCIAIACVYAAGLFFGILTCVINAKCCSFVGAVKTPPQTNEQKQEGEEEGA